MAGWVFPDTSVLCDFAAVHRLDLMSTWLRGRGRWTEAVAYEVERSASVLADLRLVPAEGWLGEAIEFDTNSQSRAIELVRRDIFGGTSAKPLQHLGEAQTLHLLRRGGNWADAQWLSDDRDALDFARKQGIIALDTGQVVAAMISSDDLRPPDAFQLLREMADRQRPIRAPTSVQDLLE